MNPHIPADLAADTERIVSFVPMEAVGEDGRLSLENSKTVGEAKAGYSYFADGDLLMAKVTPCFENGKSAIARGLQDGHGFGTTELTVLRPRPALASPRYLHYFVQTDSFRQEGAASMLGAGGLKRIPDGFIRDFKCSWPPLREQERIADFLDEKTARIDALIAEKRLLAERLSESFASQLLALISGHSQGGSTQLIPGDRDADLPAGWKFPQLARLTTKLTNGYVGPTRDILTTEGVRYLQSLHIKSGAIDFTRGEYYVSEDWSRAHSKSILQAGDILIVQTGDIGQTAVVPQEFVGCNCHALIIARPKVGAVDPRYLELVLRSSYGRACFIMYSTGALHPHLNCSNIRDIHIPLPPLGKQLEIVRTASICEQHHLALLNHVRNHTCRLEEYRSALISSAVTGQMSIDERRVLQ
ncbi:MAG: restriction endonuclease subunit S [Burkholderiales bacterium]